MNLSIKQYKDIAKSVGIDKMKQIERGSGVSILNEHKEDAVRDPKEANILAMQLEKRQLIIAGHDEVEKAKKKIVTLYDEYLGYQKRSLVIAKEIGEHLFYIKERCFKNKFIKWAKENLPFSVRTGQRYMQVSIYWEMLQKNGIATLDEAYDFIAGKPIGDEEIEADDSTDTSLQFEILQTKIELDTLKPPVKQKLKGYKGTVVINSDTIELMEKEDFPYKNSKGRCVKLVATMPHTDGQKQLVTRLVSASSNLLKKGGKLIFVKK